MTTSNRQSNQQRPELNYTAADFDSIKESLISYIKTKYPENYKDFNNSSFGSMMFDLVSYVGDMLSWYIDHTALETNIVTAADPENIEALASLNGKMPGTSQAATGPGYVLMQIPANTIGPGIDPKYIPNIENITVQSESGATFQNIAPVLASEKKMEFYGTQTATIDGAKVKTYLARIPIEIISGEQAQFVASFGSNPGRLSKLEIPDDNVTEILSCVDSDGNDFFEVDYLTQNTIYKSIVNPDQNQVDAPSLLKAVPVARRFTIERERNKNYLTFGFGSEQDLKTSEIADPADLTLKMTGREYVTQTSFDPVKTTSSDTLGVAPQNTTLTVTYRKNSVATPNAAANTINNVLESSISFKNETDLDDSIIDFIRENVQFYNSEPINGSVSVPTSEEIKVRARGLAATQSRAVTKQDYISSVYAMPSKFGAIKRCTIFRDSNDFRRNLNMYVIAESEEGKFQKASSQLKNNVKNWINSIRMISDSIDIFDAKVLNFGIQYDVTPRSGVTLNTLQADLRKEIYQKLTSIPPDIGEHLYLTDIWYILQNHPSVASVNTVRVVSKTGENYSDILYDVDANIAPGKKYIYIPPDFVWEIKKEEDIELLKQS